MKKNLFLSFIAAFLMMKAASACSFTATLNIQPCTCYGAANGAIIVNPTGGVGSLTYSLNGGAYQSSPYFTGLFPGSYTVTVLDNGDMCSMNYPATVSSPPPLTASCSSTSTSCVDLCDASLTASVGGGMPPYTYNWAGSYYSPIYPGLCAGSYTCFITDANGCTTSVMASVTAPTAVTCSVTGTTPATCGACDGQATVTASGGSAPYVYQVDGGTPQSSATFTGLCAGVHNLTATDANGCSSTVSFSLSSAGSLTLSAIDSMVPTCGACDGWIQLQASGGTMPYTYSSAAGTVSGDVVNGLCSGSNIYMANDATGCTIVWTHDLSSPAIGGLSVTAAITNESGWELHDGSIDITTSGAPGPFTFSWSNGATTEDIYSLPGGNYTVIVFDGSGNCNTYTYTVAATPTFGTVTGKVYLDANSNCTFDAGDMPIPYYTVHGPGMYTGATNTSGDYSIYLTAGTHTFAPATSVYLTPEACGSSTVDVVADSVRVIDFPMSNTGSLCDLGVSFTLWGMVPGFDFTNQIYVHNYGYTTTTATVINTLPAHTSYVSSSPAAPGFIGDSVIFTISVPPLSDAVVSVTYHCEADPSLIGSTLYSTASVEATSCTDVNPANNTVTSHHMVSGSFDPNEKAVNPMGDVTLDQEEFIYSIGFQNTGNAPAINITVTDTLSDLLDPATVEILSASHEMNYSLINGNVMHFRFNNIMLPDSTSDEPHSHGEVMFKIKRKSTVGIGDLIDNTANIYFDFNPAVITNTTHTLFVTPTLVSDFNNNTTGFTLYPNPNEGMAYIKLNGMTNATCKVYDVCGRLVITHTINTNETAIDLSKLGRGVYTVNVSDAQHNFSKQLIRK